jgi:hypothetical protein
MKRYPVCFQLGLALVSRSLQLRAELSPNNPTPDHLIHRAIDWRNITCIKTKY